MQNMLYLLQQQYPADLMPLLAEHSQGALLEAVDAFPTESSVISSNLTLFATAVEVPCTPVSASLSAAWHGPMTPSSPSNAGAVDSVDPRKVLVKCAMSGEAYSGYRHAEKMRYTMTL